MNGSLLKNKQEVDSVSYLVASQVVFQAYIMASLTEHGHFFTIPVPPVRDLSTAAHRRWRCLSNRLY